MGHVTADWNPMGEVYFRKSELYSMDRKWQEVADLKKFKIAAAPYGGPIALIRDDSKIMQVKGGARPIVYIFTSVGVQVASFSWKSLRVIHLAWTNTEDLMIIQEDGTVHLYDMLGSHKKTFTMGQDAKETKILECKTFRSFSGTGLAILTGSFRLFVVNNVEEPRLRRMAEVPGIEAAPSSWCVISSERQSHVLLAKENQLYLLDHGGHYQELTLELDTPVNAFIEMSVSFDHRFLALFADTGVFWVGSSDLKKKHCEFDTKSKTRPKQLTWCGGGAIVAYWENMLVMIGPDKDWVKYNVDSDVHLVAEYDGLRIIGTQTHEMLQRVPTVVEDIFKIGSMAPGAMLYEASREFHEKKSEKADEYIRMIQDQLPRAVQQCIQAAGAEYEPATQRMLLRAASFGKCFLSNMKPDMFVNMCQMLRVLNAVRDYRVGIPITYEQLKHLTLPVLIDRLILRRNWCLAVRICKYLKLPETEGESRILGHWACYKVQQTHVADDQIARAIQSKLGDTPGISYSEIASKAWECGRAGLAVKLLEYEPKAAEQVPLLMKMDHDDVALSKAIESGDTDLVFLVILSMKDKKKLGDFLMTLRNQPVAQSLYMQYCRQQNPDMLENLYEQVDDYLEMANIKVSNSCVYGSEKNVKTQIDMLHVAQENYKKGNNEFATKMTEEQIKLLTYQRNMEADLKQPYLNLSIHDTILELLLTNRTKLAEQLRKEFKVPDKRFWRIKIEALSENRDWIELEKFSKSKKSPIGFESFVEVCYKYGNLTEANKYVPKVPAENRVRMYLRIGVLEQAAEAAFQIKSEDDLNMVLMKCGVQNKQLAAKIGTMKSQLGKK
ncbi:vacuolar protein sorting-associated protein 16 homolog [Antedon mediterranea]|uniref:vacuolar protein sorting-associated protein 16 homolog n=1 Tax=Antedon mediterranea TaxID=105859 RepID=UPI003AF53AF7